MSTSTEYPALCRQFVAKERPDLPPREAQAAVERMMAWLHRTGMIRATAPNIRRANVADAWKHQAAPHGTARRGTAAAA